MRAQYIVEHGAETLLPRYLDMYRITVHDKDTYLIVMNNIMSSPLEIHRVYDLKVPHRACARSVAPSCRLHAALALPCCGDCCCRFPRWR